MPRWAKILLFAVVMLVVVSAIWLWSETLRGGP